MHLSEAFLIMRVLPIFMSIYKYWYLLNGYVLSLYQQQEGCNPFSGLSPEIRKQLRYV
jgi:hypothetical protein